ncbi:MAG: hypothetical protein J6I68_09230 [Butyrivibrio sp.]|nr:hypothetical protein [Butyrivibrio sp.]
MADMKSIRLNNNKSTLPGKFLYTLAVVCIYLLGRNVPLPWIVSATENSVDSLFAYTASILGTDAGQGSIFSLGISPYVTSMIIIQLLFALFRKPGIIISKVFMRRITLIITLFLAVIQSFSLLGQLTLREDAFPYMWQTAAATVITLIGGTFVIIFLSECITENGLAGTSALILVNILTTFMHNLLSYFNEPQWTDITDETVIFYGVLPAVYVVFIVFSTVLFEQSEFRIPVYRVMINNNLADENYIAIKLNPSGTMSVMFAMTFFMLPGYFVGALIKIWQEQPVLVAIQNVFNLNNYVGIAIYLMIVVLLNYSFSFIMLNPSELSKQFMEGGDCIAGLRPGKETLKYIKKCIRFCLVPSSIMQCVIVGIPLFIKAANGSDSKIFQMPITVIILTGILLKVFEEIRVIRNFRDYKAFL